MAGLVALAERLGETYTLLPGQDASERQDD